MSVLTELVCFVRGHKLVELSAGYYRCRCGRDRAYPSTESNFVHAQFMTAMQRASISLASHLEKTLQAAYYARFGTPMTYEAVRNKAEVTTEQDGSTTYKVGGVPFLWLGPNCYETVNDMMTVTRETKFLNEESNFMNTPSVVERFNLQLLNPVKYNDWIKGANAIQEACGTFEDFMAWSRLDTTATPDQDVAGMRIRWESICAHANVKMADVDRGVTFPGEYLLATVDVEKKMDWIKGARNIYRAGGSYEEFLRWRRTDPKWKESEDDLRLASHTWLKASEIVMASASRDRINPSKEAVPTTAQMLLGQARDVMDARAKEYDKPEGERSMAATVAAFNAVAKRDLSESEGWLFMSLLKMVRDRSTVAGHRDSCEDLVAYSSLYGEARLAELQMGTWGAMAADAESRGVTFQSVYDSCNAQRKQAKATAVCKHNFGTYKAENTSNVTEAPATTDVDAAQRRRIFALVKLVRDQYGKAPARFVVHHFGGTDKVPDIPADKVPKVIEAITRLYPSIEVGL